MPSPPGARSPHRDELYPPYLRGPYAGNGVASGSPDKTPVYAWNPEEKMSVDSASAVIILPERQYSLFTKCFAEFLATTIFVFIGCMQGYVGNNADAILHAAFAHGITIFFLVASIGHISGGHINPAVSLGATLTGHLPLYHLPCYFVSQMLGGCFGSILTVAILTQSEYTAILGGATLLNVEAGNTWFQGLTSEAIVTFILFHTIVNAAMDTTTNTLAPLAIGFTLTANIIATGRITGCSMNPARSFGPNLIGYFFIDHATLDAADWWTYHYIYWAGPAIGASLVAGYHWLLESRKNRVVE